MKIHIYDNGSRFVSDGSAMLKPHGHTLTQTIDLGEVSEHDKKRVFANPHDETLLAEIMKKRVR